MCNVTNYLAQLIKVSCNPDSFDRHPFRILCACVLSGTRLFCQQNHLLLILLYHGIGNTVYSEPVMSSEFRVQYGRMPGSSDPTPPSTLVWQVINGIMAIFFLLAAYVNLNDADWYIWVPVYTVPGLLSLSAVVRPKITDTTVWGTIAVVDFTLCCAFALYAVVLLLTAMKREVVNPLQHEEGRELVGLFIIIFWLGVSRFTNIGSRPGATVTNKNMMNALLLMTVTLTLLPLLTWSTCFVSDWNTKLSHCNSMFSH